VGRGGKYNDKLFERKQKKENVVFSKDSTFRTWENN
jgi:hypothetical protein